MVGGLSWTWDKRTQIAANLSVHIFLSTPVGK
jgi:hypothetical protein